jgi:hypothetical protein
MKYNLMRYWRSHTVAYTLFLDSLPDLLAQVAQKVKQIKDTEQRQNFGLSQVWWVKCILRYIPPSEGVERTTKTQRTQRSIDHIVS